MIYDIETSRMTTDVNDQEIIPYMIKSWHDGKEGVSSIRSDRFCNMIDLITTYQQTGIEIGRFNYQSVIEVNLK